MFSIFLSVIFAAIAGVLVDWLLNSLLPENPTLVHILAGIVGIVVLFIMSVWLNYLPPSVATPPTPTTVVAIETCPLRIPKFGKWDASFGVWVHSVPVPADYDGDGSIDLSTRGNDGMWNIDFAKNDFGTWDVSQNGYGSHPPVPADYDGDKIADLSIFSNDGKWYIDYSENGFNGWDKVYEDYGTSSIPALADYDGDGLADFSVRNSQGEWRIDYSANGFNGWDEEFNGYEGIPAVADYDGDCKADLGVVDDYGRWMIDFAKNGFGSFDITYYEDNRMPIDILYVVPVDYDNDGLVDLGLINNAGEWLIDYSASN